MVSWESAGPNVALLIGILAVYTISPIADGCFGGDTGVTSIERRLWRCRRLKRIQRR